MTCPVTKWFSNIKGYINGNLFSVALNILWWGWLYFTPYLKSSKECTLSSFCFGLYFFCVCGFFFSFLALSVSKKFMYCCGSLGVAKLRYLIFGYNVTGYSGWFSLPLPTPHPPVGSCHFLSSLLGSLIQDGHQHLH